jgi:GTPase SAR1 family protein
MASRGLGSIGSKKLMDFNDSLRECNLHRYGIGIPQIAVVGQQSSGKSSVLEAITGVPFPRDSALCTRGPMEVRIKSCDSKEEERIQVWAEHTAKRDPIFLAGKNSTAQLEGCMRAVIDTLMAEEKQSSFTDKVAYVEIHKMHEPPLTVIDLPGYFQGMCSLCVYA